MTIELSAEAGGKMHKYADNRATFTTDKYKLWSFIEINLLLLLKHLLPEINISTEISVLSSTWMRRHKQASESGFRAKVDHKSSLTIYAHAGWVQST